MTAHLHSMAHAAQRQLALLAIASLLVVFPSLAEARSPPPCRDRGGPVLWWSSRAETLRVFIEGDGYAYDARGAPSRDPTPHRRTMRLLAVQSTASAYLARPCQFRMSLERCASAALWTSARFDSETLTLINSALDELKSCAGATRLELVGYSGGGVIALLLAAQRPDVSGLVTLAAPLDLAAWTEHHQLSPLQSALDPIDAIARLTIPQLHVRAAGDRIVPDAVLARVDAVCRAPLCETLTVRGDHECCWRRNWREIDETYAALRARFSSTSPPARP